jgi:anthranilate synthase component 1
LNFKKIPFTHSPLEVFSKLYQNYSNVFLLESIEGPKKLAQFSFIGFDPHLVLQSKNGQASTYDAITGRETKSLVADPLNAIKPLINRRVTANKEFRFAGGAVGYISYDAVRCWEKLPVSSKEDLGFPDLEMGFFDDGLVFDHKQKRAHYYYYVKNRLVEIQDIISKPAKVEELTFGLPKVNIAKEAYEASVEKAKKYVTAGDVFQVVLSKRFDFKYKGSLTEFYRSLRAINPSPYMYFLKFGDRQIVGSSPEMLVRVDNGTVETYPIAGTSPVAKNAVENRRLSRELLADPKERAEHVMLVDLARNDIGKISKYGSVRVPEFMQVHRFSHVQHIVSRVVGDLKEDCDAFDALRAVFPAGTVSGAPKVRAMEIIGELESSQRGPYAGAVGYFSYNGNADFAITIRTLFAQKNQAYIQAGAGIVADSVPEKEWAETDHKANALMKAMQIHGGGSK